MSFMGDLKKNADVIRAQYTPLWQAVGETAISPVIAKEMLELLWQRSHLDILEHNPAVAKYFPTKQCYPGRLSKGQNLWWVDHATAGINGWGTLMWFSSAPRKHARKLASKAAANAYARHRQGTVKEKGDKFIVTWTGLAGASTHFVIFPDGTPFYLVKIEDGCWGEPKRNGDGIHVEMVNALTVRFSKGSWKYWAGKIPEKLIQAQPPTDLEVPFRGATHMQPYTWEQVITNIKLKRLCAAATQRLDPDRMSQHTDWRESKFDMGPLWPFDLCNQAVFENFPIEDYSFVQQFVRAPGMDLVVDLSEIEESVLRETEANDPEVEHDLFDEDNTIDTVLEVQETLISLYGPGCLPKYGADGDLGKESTTALKVFQADWNRNRPADRIKVDGIPGTATCGRMEKALALSNFKTS